MNQNNQLDLNQYISLKGARVHNLKNLSLDIPKNRLVVFTGVSGSGKTSLAFDTIYAEGQRRYVQSLSSYARQFLGVMGKPDLDSITGLSPAISIDQKTVSHNPRSTVGTVTEIYDFLRLLFARIGHPHCPSCGQEIKSQSAREITTQLLEKIKEMAQTQTIADLYLLSPVVRDRKGEFKVLLEKLLSQGFAKARIDGQFYDLATSSSLGLIKTNRHSIDAVVDHLLADRKQLKNPSFLKILEKRLLLAVETGLKLSSGFLSVLDFSKIEKLYSEHFACPDCNISLPEIEPRLFSFNSPHGACPACTGLGTLLKIDPDLILDRKLSISEGGIRPIARMMEHDSWTATKIRALAREEGFSLAVPLKRLNKNDLKILLYGSNGKKYTFTYTDQEGQRHQQRSRFEGIISNLERRFFETNSEYMRQEIGRYMRKETCPSCHGSRLTEQALSVTIFDQNINQISDLPLKDLFLWLKKVSADLSSPREKEIASPIIKELSQRLDFLLSVGLSYLTTSRPAQTLAGGESQRIRLASQVGAGLSGVLYVLDEPTIGLHQRDNQRLIETLKNLRDMGNSVIVVEHDREMMEEADLIFDFGPGAGQEGGRLVAQGNAKELSQNSASLTGAYLSGKKKIDFLSNKNQISEKKLILKNCRQHNLKDITASFPLGCLVCITGVSGSGKSTLVNETLYHALSQKLNPRYQEKAGDHSDLLGWEEIDRVLFIDQSPIGRTPRSNPATYSGAFTYIRDLFAQTPEARIQGFHPGRFSFNVKGGRCEVCQGGGEVKIEMQFLPDLYVTCDVCQGSRYNPETLEVFYKGKNIQEILDLSIDQALDFFRHFPPLASRLQTLIDVGLGYMKLGQGAPTLSGGEAQRLKLSRELTKTTTGRALYILDEPTTGLHFEDLKKLLKVLRRLTEKGNTVLVIEHNLDVIKNADWIIDLGPEGGDAGGEIIATGTPQQVSKAPRSLTGQYLKPLL